jgi:hypothetical protein
MSSKDDEQMKDEGEDATDREKSKGRMVELDDEAEELDAEELEIDEVEEAVVKKESAPETGAILVIGQGDFSMRESNRGADDPGDNTLADPQFLCKYGDMLFVSDRGNHRVVVWNQMPQENGEPASLVLGQEEFSDCRENRGLNTTLDEMTSGLGDETLEGFTVSKAEPDTLSQPAGVRVIGGQLYVCDSGNHRVLRWSGLPSEDGEAPNLVLGQDNLDCNEANRRGIIGSGSLFFPFGIYSGDDKTVIVADKDNHRILIWKKIPFSNGWNADICLGQSDMDQREPNRGEYDKCGPDTLSFPTGMFYDPQSERLIVVDQGNHRVLIWNKIPARNGQPADMVLGQKDFYSREVNGGISRQRANNFGFHFPTDVACGRKGLFISDANNNRVMMWKEMPTENGQPADLALGQTSLTENKFNRNGACSHCTLNDPYGMLLVEDPDNEEDPGRLFICDRGNSRIVVWEELPKSADEDDGSVELDEVVVESDEIMGDDDEFFAAAGETDRLPEKKSPA